MRISSSCNSRLGSLKKHLYSTHVLCRCADVVIVSVPSYKQKLLQLWTYRGFGKFGGPEGSGPGEGAERTKDPRIPKVYGIRDFQRNLPKPTTFTVTTIYYHLLPSTTILLPVCWVSLAEATLCHWYRCASGENTSSWALQEPSNIYTPQILASAFSFLNPWTGVFFFAGFCQLTFLGPSDSLTTVQCTTSLPVGCSRVANVFLLGGPFLQQLLDAHRSLRAEMQWALWPHLLYHFLAPTYTSLQLTSLFAHFLSYFCAYIDKTWQNIQLLFLHSIEGMLRSGVALLARFSFIYWQASFPFSMFITDNRFRMHRLASCRRFDLTHSG